MPKTKVTRAAGKCALTGDVGAYVDCHIIPEGLSITTWKGQPLAQKGRDGRLIRRWTSWYDPKLVTQKGENILQSYDDWGIKFLKEHKLIWRSWGPMVRLATADHQLIGTTGKGHRILKDIDCRRLRLFLLSILWRGVATSLWEFEGVKLDQSDYDLLTNMVLSGNTDPYDFLYVGLIQYNTIAPLPFNQTIIKAAKRRPSIVGGEPDFEHPVLVNFYRLYFDGLVVNFNLNDRDFSKGAIQCFVDATGDFALSTISAQHSVFLNSFYEEIGMPVSEHYLKEKAMFMRAKGEG